MKALIILLLSICLHANTYYIKDMACEVCVDFISFCASKVSKDYKVNLDTKTLIINDKKYDEKTLLKCLKEQGYEATKK